jgi:hypothetical protein
VIADLLRDEAAWPLEAKLAIEAGQANGIHERSMRRAAKRMGIRIDRAGFGRGGKWLWHRPAPIADTYRTAFPEHPEVSPMAAMEKRWEKEEEALKSVHRGHDVSAIGAKPFVFDHDPVGRGNEAA